MIDIDAYMLSYWLELTKNSSSIALFDAHTHLGQNDPDGMKQSPAELLASLAPANARAVTFPMHELDGYPPANDMVLEACASSDGKLIPFCRVNPHMEAVTEVRRCLDAGARGIKLHPRAEAFALNEPEVENIVALAHERHASVLFHAGRGIPALGRDLIRLADKYPDASLILAHAAVSDLAWLWHELPKHPNLFVDTAWWNPSDLITLFTLAPPSQILWASDSPYGRPLQSAAMALRCALQAGVSERAFHSIAGEQLQRVVNGEAPIDAGPPPMEAVALDPLLERVVSHLMAAFGRLMIGGAAAEPISLALLATQVSADDPYVHVHTAVSEMINFYEEAYEPPAEGVIMRITPASRFLVGALVVARTPDVPIPMNRLG